MIHFSALLFGEITWKILKYGLYLQSESVSAFLRSPPVEGALRRSFFGFLWKHFPLSLHRTPHLTSPFHKCDKVLVPKCTKCTAWVYFSVAFWFPSCASSGNFSWDVGVFLQRNSFSSRSGQAECRHTPTATSSHCIPPSSCCMGWVHLYVSHLVRLNLGKIPIKWFKSKHRYYILVSPFEKARTHQ